MIITRKIQAGPLNVPGAAGVYANQPFWSDLIVVLVHPQFALGLLRSHHPATDGGQRRLWAPDDIAITVSDLDTCSRGVAPDAAGYQFLTAKNATETLTASECKALASLDPFWALGNRPLGARGQEWGAPQQNGTTSQGSVRSLDLQDITSQQETVTTQSTATYSATAEDIAASTQSAGMNIGETTAGTIPRRCSPQRVGQTPQAGIEHRHGRANHLNLTYKNSSATSYRQDVQTEGRTNDTVNRGYTPTVETYLDLVFGSFMFRDPNAPCNPMPRCEIMRNVAPIVGPARAVQ